MGIKTLTWILFLTFCQAVYAQDKGYQWILNMMSKDKEIRREAAAHLIQINNSSYAPGMVDMLFFYAEISAW